MYIRCPECNIELSDDPRPWTRAQGYVEELLDRTDRTPGTVDLTDPANRDYVRSILNLIVRCDNCWVDARCQG